MTAPNVAMVTGGSTGIGWEICRQILDAGYEVVSLARRRPPQSHAKLHAVEVDLIDAAATGQAAADVASRFPVAFTCRCRKLNLVGVAHRIGSRWPGCWVSSN